MLLFSRLLLRPIPSTLRLTTKTMSSSSTSFYSSSSKDDPTPSQSQNTLPAPGESSTPTTLDVSGDGTTVKLDHLGPLVVNVDGTMSRIGNWSEMAEIERQNTVRIIGRRNKQRLEVLRKAKEKEQGE